MRVVVTHRTAVLATAALLAGGMTFLASTGTASAISPDITISQVYGGGGNSGASLTSDFVELFNRGTTSVALTGWSVQYASSTGTSWRVTPLSGVMPPGTHYLVAEAAGAGGTQPLPTPDATGTTAMSATSGKVALVTSASALGCGANCSSAAGVHDFVGYGSANDSEGGPAPTLSNTTAALRGGAGGMDTDNNATDFVEGTPTPRNSASGGGGPVGARIHQIQAAGHISPDNGLTVADVPGVVTAVGARQFWMQDPQPDADPATSEAVSVFTSTAPAVAVGDSVTVSGSVNEFRPGGSGGVTNLTTTEIVTPTVSVVTHNNPLPAPTLVGSGGRVPPSTVIENDASGSVENSGVFDPNSDGIDFWESMEGMRVEIDDAQVVGPTNSFGELPVVPLGASIRTNRGGIVLQANDPNPERVILDDTLAATPTANVGDTLTGATVGVLDYGFGNFMLEVTTTPTLHAGGLARETTTAPSADQLAVATFNVENLSPVDPQTKFNRLADTVVTNLASPDLIAVEEIQDNDGPTNDGVVAADQTLSKLVTAIQAAGGPTYSWREIDPVNDQDGGQPGGNIRVVFLFRTDRGLSFVDIPGGDSTTATQVVVTAGAPHLSFSPGRVDPANAAWNASRKPLAGEFRFAGHTLFVIANHFASKLGDQPLFGQFQPPARSSETQRHQQATVLRGFVDDIFAADPNADVIALGDLNDFDFSQTADILVGTGNLVDLPRTLPLSERYTFDFEGNSQVLDHILVSDALAHDATGTQTFDYDVVHVNSEFADQVSDHDPQVVRLTM